ncbi:MAG: TIGR01777 family oxidoreductase [Cyclobacteriaceae bacterium]|nr:TIGR01777 family oxidoreductase [Cyclobacteriaceae bacterium]
MTNSVLITGATGMIGRRLTAILLQKGCRVSHLGRKGSKGNVPSFQWDPDRGEIDVNAFKGIDTIIHLAGAGIADKRWSAERKHEILDSRVRSTQLLLEALRQNPHTVKTVVAASAIGFYGMGLDDKFYLEDSLPGSDFLAEVTRRWEEETVKFSTLGIRVVAIRIGIVLSTEGGALKEMIRPVAWGVGAPLGTGSQYVSWIHLDDLCKVFSMAVMNVSMQGVYNAVAPKPVTNRDLTYAIAEVLQRKIWLPPVPSFILKVLLGEMADMVTLGNRVSCQRLLDTGFTFEYPELKGALIDLVRTEPT